MTPRITRSDFAALARRTGIALSEEQISALYEAEGWVEAMLDTLHRPRAPAIEPAHIFDPEAAR